MSILLDALRKSEEQRRLGSAPSIHSGPERGTGGGDGAQQWIPLSLIALAAIGMAWIGWQQYERPPEAALAEAPAGVERAVAAGGEEAGAAADDAAAARLSARPATAPVRRTVRRTPVETFTQGDEAPEARADLESAEAPLADARKARVSESFQAYEADSVPTGEDQRPGEPESGPGPPERAREARPAAERPATEPITFWELPQGVRDSLPELRITVLVYADRPEDRFLLMSGQRLIEKDEFEGVVLDEIRRDGAVFLYRNYRFLVKG